MASDLQKSTCCQWADPRMLRIAGLVSPEQELLLNWQCTRSVGRGDKWASSGSYHACSRLATRCGAITQCGDLRTEYCPVVRSIAGQLVHWQPVGTATNLPSISSRFGFDLAVPDAESRDIMSASGQALPERLCWRPAFRMKVFTASSTTVSVSSISAWMVEALDDEAQRLGITAKSLIKVWIADRLEQRKDCRVASAA